MTVQQQYYSTRDVAKILSVSKTTANQIMHIFEHRGQLLRFGNTMRIGISDFNDWIREQKNGGKYSGK